ncbi:hypothetical protein ApNV_068 [Aratus pisonii nudivirus]|nr:hypothetical protein ApNV_068 [Aratus pisonii nudivirus]
MDTYEDMMTSPLSPISLFENLCNQLSPNSDSPLNTPKNDESYPENLDGILDDLMNYVSSSNEVPVEDDASSLYSETFQDRCTETLQDMYIDICTEQLQELLIPYQTEEVLNDNDDNFPENCMFDYDFNVQLNNLIPQVDNMLPQIDNMLPQIPQQPENTPPSYKIHIPGYNNFTIPIPLATQQESPPQYSNLSPPQYVNLENIQQKSTYEEKVVIPVPVEEKFTNKEKPIHTILLNTSKKKPSVSIKSKQSKPKRLKKNVQGIVSFKPRTYNTTKSKTRLHMNETATRDAAETEIEKINVPSEYVSAKVFEDEMLKLMYKAKDDDPAECTYIKDCLKNLSRKPLDVNKAGVTAMCHIYVQIKYLNSIVKLPTWHEYLKYFTPKSCELLRFFLRVKEVFNENKIITLSFDTMNAIIYNLQILIYMHLAGQMYYQSLTLHEKFCKTNVKFNFSTEKGSSLHITRNVKPVLYINVN